MVTFEEFNLKEDLKEELRKLKVDFVFHPIYYPDGKKVYAYEALMRPEEKEIKELIDEYMDAGKLHVLEVASFFGALKVYDSRGHEEPVCISSFPSEVFTETENKEYDRHFSKYVGKGFVKILEYPDIAINKWERKSRTLKRKSIDVSLNNFGEGNNDFEALNIFRPKVIKIGRELTGDIHKDENRQIAVLRCIQKFHDLGSQVIAGGIECKEELDFLVPNGVDYVQGFYFGQPE